jgi:glycogen phosphorylase
MFRPAFSTPTSHRFLVLVLAAVLTTGRRTVTNLLRTAREKAPGHRSAYHRVFSQRRWSAWVLARMLMPPRTCFFAGKAAPAYRLAKLIIKLIGNVASVIDADPAVRGRLKVLFLPEYNVSLAERLIPASDVSEQISTAGFEASGTSNMKFMMNGALTVGTRDGATVEMAREAGEEHFFLFGLTAEQVQDSRGWYNPHWHYDHEPETRRALDMIRDNAFSQAEPGIFTPIWDVLLTHGDYYRHLADLSAYIRTQEQVSALYTQPDAWVRKAILNVGHSGQFSSDRTITEYAADIWQAKPCPVE